jgi:hypothetical protein
MRACMYVCVYVCKSMCSYVVIYDRTEERKIEGSNEHIRVSVHSKSVRMNNSPKKNEKMEYLTGYIVLHKKAHKLVVVPCTQQRFPGECEMTTLRLLSRHM